MLADRYPNKTRTAVQFYYTTSVVSPFCRKPIIYGTVFVNLQILLTVFFEYLDTEFQYAIQTKMSDQMSPTPLTAAGMLSISVNGAVNTR